MKHCRNVRSLLLEAEPEELAGEGSSNVAQHIRTCAACGAIASRILEETAVLDTYLAQVPSAPDVDAILARAGVDEAASEVSAKVLPFPAWRGWAALAAAAAVAGLFFFRSDAPLQMGSTNTFEAPPLVEAAPDQNFAVLSTANPDITVLWFF